MSSGWTAGPSAWILALTLAPALFACRDAGNWRTGGDARPPVPDILRIDAARAFALRAPDDSSTLLFAFPTAGTGRSDGTFVVADGLLGVIHLFDANGRLSATVGRKGRGPGEFQTISWLDRCAADTVFAWDFALGRMSVVRPDGHIVRQERLTLDALGDAPPAALACADRRFAVLGRPVPGPGPRVDAAGEEDRFAVVQTRLIVVDREFRTIRDFGWVDAGDFVISGGFFPRPLGRVTGIALSSKHVYVGTAASSTVTAYGVDGSAGFTVDVGGGDRRATLPHREAAAEALTAWLGDADLRARMRRRLLEMPAPEPLPPYWGLFTDSEDRLWALISPPGDSVTVLRSPSQDGGTVIELRIPTAVRVLEVGSDYVLAVGGAGEPSVIVYRVERPPTAP